MSTFLPTKHNLREALLFCFNLKKSATDGHRLLCEAYGKHALSIKSCEYWFRRFKSGDIDTRDKERGGRPIKFEDAELEALLDEDSSQTQEVLAETLGVTQQAISNRLKVMGMVQKQGNWVPYELKPGNIERHICTCELLLKRQNRKGFLHRIVTGDKKWIHYDNPKRRKSWVKPGHASTSTAKPNIHGKKLMLCIWWDQLGVIYYELLQPNETITGERYQQQLMRLSRALKIKRPLYAKRHDKVIYQHDNARPHVAKVVKETLEALQWDVLPHPLYSPDIALSDYHMFRSMTHGLAEQHFTSYEEAKNWVNVWIASKDKEFFRQGIRMLPERWEKVNASAFVINTGSTTQWQADLAPKEMAASDMRNRHHVQLLLTWSTNAAHPLEKKKMVKDFSVKLLLRLKPLQEQMAEVRIQADNSQLPRSLQERHEPSQSNDHLIIERRLQEAIEAASSTSIAIPTPDSASYSTMINHELNIAAQSGKRGPHLERNGHLAAQSLDVSRSESVQHLFASTQEKFSRAPDVLVNCAGITRDTFLFDMTEQMFDDVIAVNLKGTFLMTQAACKLMAAAKTGGSVVNVSSIVGKVGNMGQTNYAASKAGVVGLTKTVAKEMAQHNIRCNAIMPGFIDTPMVAAVPDKVLAKVTAMIPLRRKGTPEEIAELCSFLASDSSSYITGEVIEITGGLYM
ncbi:SETMAR [Cordylochernes scorpioides]|uniref:SETMAR n=1 Tax=Cordylochernes scorpioides TaxID=51811 RepID=A0ABY6KKI2_9ARAC|nr:SETMAR [Cordylochernes scorpioides]